MSRIPLFIVAGATASGKSFLALELAQHFKGEIINCDSMQVYDHLAILTAQPKEADLKTIPHHLYGVLKRDEIGSMAWWYKEASDKIKTIHQRGVMPIVVGGTGLYLNTLIQGLAYIPDIPDDIRQLVRLQQQQMSRQDFYQYVIAQDPKLIEFLHPSDAQRLMRALEVVIATGKSIKDWQQSTIKYLDLAPIVIEINIPRPKLYEKINQRVVDMVQEGVLEEVKEFLDDDFPLDHPLRKALGLPEFTSYLKGDLSLEKAIEMTQQASRRYAKRQLTWLNHQLSPSFKIQAWHSPEELLNLFKLFENFLVPPDCHSGN